MVRPRSGANDVMCQLEKSIAFAERHDRWVAVTTDGSGLPLPLFDLFEKISAKVPIVDLAEQPQLMDVLNSLSCFPPEVGGALDSYFSIFHNLGEEPGSRHILARRPSWNEKRKHLGAQVVLHDSGGGGFASQEFLKRVRLDQGFRVELADRLAALPTHYVGVHVRNTDLASDWESVLDAVDNLRAGQPVFLATDSREVQDAAIRRFASQDLYFGSFLSNENGEPLHSSFSRISVVHRRQQILDIFFDLLALGFASSFVYGGFREPGIVSGFSRLGRFFFHRPDVARNILGLPEFRRRGAEARRKSIHIGSPLEVFSEKLRSIGRMT